MAKEDKMKREHTIKVLLLALGMLVFVLVLCLGTYQEKKNVKPPLTTKQKKHLDKAANHHALGDARYNEGKYDQAIAHYQKARDMNMGTVKKHISALADTCYKLGSAYSEQHMHEQAIACYNQAVNMYGPLLGKNHTFIADIYCSLGYAYGAQAKHGEAAACYKEALKTYVAVLGKHHRDTAEGHYNLGIAYAKQHQYREALTHLKEALATQEKVLGKQHEHTIASRDTISDVERKYGWRAWIPFYGVFYTSNANKQA